MPDNDLMVRVSKVSDKGLVQIPLEIRERLGLEPGTKMIIMTAGDIVVLRKAQLLFERDAQGGLLRRIRGIFSKVPIRNIEE